MRATPQPMPESCDGPAELTTMTRSYAPQLSSGHAAPCVAASVTLAERLNRLIQTLLLWHERTRQRRHLQDLSDHMLRDIGLVRADVLAETDKPFWRD
jgi:uncharacterized protein YjiS (DUF1127 family)